MRGYLTKYKCKSCGGKIRETILESHYVCENCNEDYGHTWEDGE